jgi:uncharacterized repeat protein (TIGR01451 family)
MIRIKRKSARKFLAILANLSLLLNSFLPLLLTAPAVFAQDFSPTPTPVVEFTPTPEPSAEDPTPPPEAESPTPEPTEEPVYDESNTPTPDLTEEITVTPPPPSDLTPTPPPTGGPTDDPTPTPTIEPVNSEIGTLTPTTEITRASKKKDIKPELSLEILELTEPLPIVWTCQDDLQGPNDEPGQKDLTKMCSDYGQLPETLYTKWNWDEIKWTGTNTGDACNLIDTDNDGLANFSLCVSVEGNPASFKNQALFSCSDTRPDRCTGSSLISSTSTCFASVLEEDPFLEGDAYPKDTVANCTINMSDFSSEDARLIDVCSYPSQQPNSDPSDCIITATNNDTGYIQVNKTLIPSSDAGKFNLQIDGTTIGSGNVGDGGTTGSIELSSGNHTVGETAGTDTDLSDYTSSISCVDRDLSTFDGVSPLTLSGPGPLTVPVGKDDDIVCTITNTVQTATLTLQKTVTNDNGGSAKADDFQAKINDLDVDWGVAQILPIGSHTASETTLPGYIASVWGGDCAANGSITLAPGDNKTCTITNDDIQPKLTVTKIVSGSDEPVSNFSLFVDSTSVISGETNGFDAGEYIVSETPNDDFSSAISGDCSPTDGKITLSVGDDKSCTITNTRKTGDIKFTKIVTVGSELPSLWTFGVYQNNTLVGIYNHDQIVSLKTGSYTVIEYGPTSYFLDSISGTACIASSTPGTANLTVTDNGGTCIFGNSQKGSITIIKDSIPDSDQDFNFTAQGTGVSGFTLDDGTDADGISNSVTFSGLIPGSFTISESAVNGWYLSNLSCSTNITAKSIGPFITNIASFNLQAGENVSCTFTNTKYNPAIQVDKSSSTTDITDTGQIVYYDFNVTNPGDQVLTGITVTDPMCDSAPDYQSGDTNLDEKLDLTETWIYTCSHTVTQEEINTGGDLSNTVTADSHESDPDTDTLDIPITQNPALTIVKTATPSTYDQVGDIISYSFLVTNTGNVSFTGPVTINDDKATDESCPAVSTVGNLDNELDPDENITCTASYTITLEDLNAGSVTNYAYATIDQTQSNTDDETVNSVAGKIIIEKQTLPDGSANSFEFDPSWSIDNFTLKDGETNDSGWLIPGTYSVSEIVPAGWDLTNATCVASSDPTHAFDPRADEFTLIAGDSITCTFTNTKLGSINVCKFVDNNGNLIIDGEDTVLSDIDMILEKQGDAWEYHDRKETAENGCSLFINLIPGNYRIIEDYSDSDLTGYYPTSGNKENQLINFTVTAGSEESGYFLNAKYRTIEGSKFNDLNGDGIWNQGEPGLENWTIFIDGNYNGLLDGGEVTTTTDEFGNYKFSNLVADSYRIAEKLELDWTQTYPSAGYYDIDLHTAISSSDNNFGNVQLSDIHGYKWHDLDENGQKDSVEPLLSDWTINLYRWNGESYQLINTMDTDDNSHFGWYWFEDLLPGQYQVCEYLKNGWQQTYPGTGICHQLTLPQDKSAQWSINMIEGPEYNFGNIEYGSVEVTKFNDLDGDGKFDDGEAVLSGWDINLSDNTQTTGENGQVLFDQLLPDTYYLSENIKPGWEQTNIYCLSDSDPTPTVTPTITIIPTITATPTPDTGEKIDICRYNSGKKEYNAITISINAYHPEGENGDFLYKGNFPVNSSVADEWCQANIPETLGVFFNKLMNVQPVNAVASPNGHNNYPINLTAGQNLNCYIGNQFVEPELTISKSNNRWPSAQSIGSEVEYTITLNVHENDIDNVSVVDLPPLGFKYKPGSYQVLVNGSSRSIPQPVYSSPGTWEIGDLSVGDVVTLKYIATIQNSVDPGTYKDAAWAYGFSGDEKVLAQAIDPGKLTTKFVGTQIKIDPNLPGQPVDLVREEGQVLGASTQLPATGANTVWMIIFFILSALGLSTLYYGLKPNKKNMAKSIIIIFLISLFTLIPAKSAFAFQSENIFIGLENPISPTNQDNFNIAFTTLDILNRPLTVKCFKINPDFSEVQIGVDIAVKPGGNSGNCLLENNRLSESGKTYYFYAIASSGGESYRSDSVVVDYNTSGPGTPAYYQKDKEGTCRYKISFEASNDGKTNRIDIYRSDLTKFIADSGSKIGEVGISPGQKGSFTDVNVPDCQKTYYYVIRAFDSAGNSSGLTGDFQTIYTTTQTSSDTTGSVVPAIPLIGDEDVIPPEEEVDQDDLDADEPQEGTVLGSEISPNLYSNLKTWVEDHPLLSVLATLFLVIVIRYVLNKLFRKKR